MLIAFSTVEFAKKDQGSGIVYVLTMFSLHRSLGTKV